MTLADAHELLTCDEFAGDVVGVARVLIGREFVVRDATERRALIVETEAYAGADDPASHAAFKPRGRAAIMFDAPGRIYVYAAYGMHPCLNIVCGPVGVSSAVLLRGVWLPGDGEPILGPGRVSRALGVTLDDHGASCGDARFGIVRRRVPFVIQQSTRVGVARAVERPWRFQARERLA